jgi:ribose transport system permease protein
MIEKRALGLGTIMQPLRTAIVLREFALLGVLVIFGIIMALASPAFLTKGNIEALLLGLSVEGTIAVGMVMVMITGGFDLSVGSTLAFTGVVTGLALTSGIPTPVSVVLGLLAALGVGLANGLLVAKLRINAFIATLGMMLTVRGLLLVLAQGKTVLNLPSDFTVIGQGTLVGIQIPIYIMLVVVIVGDLLMRNSKFFRQNYYVGGNEKAARLSGMNVDRIKIVNFCIVALLAGLAGLMITARFGASSVTVGNGIELRVITAAIIGGASLNGGEGSVLGAFLGALFMGMLANALNLFGVDSYWQNLVTGLILIVAVVIDVINERRKSGQA